MQARPIKANAVDDRIAELENEFTNFSYIVSHDLTATFRHIDGFMELLTQDLGSDVSAENLEHICRVRAAAERCQSMLNELLVFSRVQTKPLDWEECDAQCLTEAARLQLSQLVRETGAKFSIEALGPVFVDQVLITGAFRRIFENSIKFRRPDAPPHITVWRVPDLQDCVLRIADNGQGVDTDQAEKLFEMFYRSLAHKDSGGVGAGLAVGRRLVRRHGGDLKFIEWPDGACVEMRLPTATANFQEG